MPRTLIYANVCLPVVLHGHETWPFIVREKHKLKVTGYKMPFRISGYKRDEAKCGWRRLHKYKLHTLHSPADIFTIIKLRRMPSTVHAGHIGGMRNSYKILAQNF
jgi:hypothetical protein